MVLTLDVSCLVQLDPPENLQVAPKSNVLAVTWGHNDEPLKNDSECEVHAQENGPYTVVSSC